jgi:hypothetical protein
MKRKILLYIIILAFLPLVTDAQEENKIPTSDTIFIFGGKKMNVDIKKITPDSILYSEKGGEEIKRMWNGNVYKVKYESGKMEIINTTPKQKKEKIDWRKVKVVKKKKHVVDFIEVQKIEATAKGSGRGYQTPKTLKRKALTILRKKAANLNANYILIVNESISAAFGDIPSATYTGIAYRDESQ